MLYTVYAIPTEVCILYVTLIRLGKKSELILLVTFYITFSFTSDCFEDLRKGLGLFRYIGMHF